jgi:phage terminase small subunit
MTNTKSKSLSVKQQMFCDAILQGKTQREAYRIAGYKFKDDNTLDASASQLLSSTKISSYLSKKRGEIEKKTMNAIVVSKTQWLEELKTVGFSKITDYLEFDESGVAMKKSDEIDVSKIAAIESVESETTSYMGEDGDRETLKTKTKFKLHRKLDALQKIGEALGFLNAPPVDGNNIQVNINVIGGNQSINAVRE